MNRPAVRLQSKAAIKASANTSPLRLLCAYNIGITMIALTINVGRKVSKK
jgi:hypothetical protein